jgi:hypothetical protein
MCNVFAIALLMFPVMASAFFVDDRQWSQNRGEHQPAIEQTKSAAGKFRPDSSKRGLHRGYTLNLTFAFDPGIGKYHGVIGNASDHWNYVKHGQSELTRLQLADGAIDDVTVQLSANDGSWGITGLSGIYHGYIYHNCRCVDLAATLRYLPAGTYDVYVFAHGDAPDQNAAIQIQSAGQLYTGKSTLNDGSWDFRSSKLKAGNQYVRYRVAVDAGVPMVIFSKRDGSSYAMFNAIQIRRVE